MSQRQDILTKTAQERGYLRAGQGEKGGGGQFYTDSFTETGCRENKLDTGEDRMSQRMRKN